MRVEVQAAPYAEEELKFPVLMESVEAHDRLVVLFVGLQTGMQMSTNGTGLHYSSNWLDATDAIQWRPFRGSVILRN